jgi:hypothetical protein
VSRSRCSRDFKSSVGFADACGFGGATAAFAEGATALTVAGFSVLLAVGVCAIGAAAFVGG